MRGSRTTEETKEKIIAAYHAGESYSKISKMLGVAKSTISGVIQNYKNSEPDVYEQVRTEMAIDMIKRADGIANQILDLIEKKLALTASCDEALIQTRINELTSAFASIFDRLEVMKNRSADDDGGGIIEIASVGSLEEPDENEVSEVEE